MFLYDSLENLKNKVGLVASGGGVRHCFAGKGARVVVVGRTDFLFQKAFKVFAIYVFVNLFQGFLNGGYFPVDRAMELLTFDGDRDILRNACQIYQKYRETIA